MSRFEKKRMSLLIGDKSSVSSTDTQDSHKHTDFLTKEKQLRNKPPKSNLFSDYNYINMIAKRGNSFETLSFPCFKDCLIFEQILPLRPMQIDNDNQSDDEQIKQCKKRMVTELRQQIIKHKYDRHYN